MRRARAFFIVTRAGCAGRTAWNPVDASFDDNVYILTAPKFPASLTIPSMPTAKTLLLDPAQQG